MVSKWELYDRIADLEKKLRNAQGDALFWKNFTPAPTVGKSENYVAFEVAKKVTGLGLTTDTLEERYGYTTERGVKCLNLRKLEEDYDALKAYRRGKELDDARNTTHD